MTGQSRPTLATLRDAVGRRVDETSLRATADEIGMSWSGLKSFRDGGSPHRATIEKLVRWHASRAHQVPAIARDELDAALELVLRYVRDESKPKAVRERRLREIRYKLIGDQGADE